MSVAEGDFCLIRGYSFPKKTPAFPPENAGILSDCFRAAPPFFPLTPKSEMQFETHRPKTVVFSIASVAPSQRVFTFNHLQLRTPRNIPNSEELI
jgi:hypothetical protein